MTAPIHATHPSQSITGQTGASALQRIASPTPRTDTAPPPACHQDFLEAAEAHRQSVADALQSCQRERRNAEKTLQKARAAQQSHGQTKGALQRRVDAQLLRQADRVDFLRHCGMAAMGVGAIVALVGGILSGGVGALVGLAICAVGGVVWLANTEEQAYDLRMEVLDSTGRQNSAD